MLAGTIVERIGEPVAGASIVVAKAPVAVPDIALLSAADGKFALDAPLSGTYRLVIRAGERRKEVELDVPLAGEVGIRIEL